MPSLLFNTWVKIVNKRRITSGISCGRSSTITQHKQNGFIAPCVETILTNQTLPHNSTVENTPKIHKLHLLNKSFTHFPQHLLINPLKEN